MSSPSVLPLRDDRITSKIGLANTYYGAKTNLYNDECYSYKYDIEWKQEQEGDMSAAAGSGAVISTPSDLTKFIEALFAFKLISKSSLGQMKRIDRIGMGIKLYLFGKKKLMGMKVKLMGFYRS